MEPKPLAPDVDSILESHHLRNTISLLVKKGFTRDEAKVLVAGFSLVKYFREEKKVIASCKDPLLGWYLVGIKTTYAAAERELKDRLQDAMTVESCVEGKIVMNTSAKKLYAAGFDFFRMRGVDLQYGESPKIVQGRSNWSTWGKYETVPAMVKEWFGVVMPDPKALQG